MDYSDFGYIEITPPKGLSKELQNQLLQNVSYLLKAVERDRGNGKEYISDLYPGMAIRIKK